MFSDDLKKNLLSTFADLANPLTIVWVKDLHDQELNQQAINLLNHVSELNSFIQFEELSDQNPDLLKKYWVEFTPCTLVLDRDNNPVLRYYGLPQGHEFSSFIHAIIFASKKHSGFSEQFVEKIQSIRSICNVDIFVTPS